MKKYVPLTQSKIFVLERHQQYIMRLVNARGTSVNQQTRDIIEHCMQCTCFDRQSLTSEHPPQKEAA